MTNLFRIFIFIFSISITIAGQDFRKLDTLANHLITKYKLPGMAAVAVQNGNIVYKLTLGKANEHRLFNDSTKIYIASNTKAFTALALSKLVYEKKISFSDHVNKYIPEKYLPKNIEFDKITIKNLLEHTHGLSNDPMVFRTAYSGEYPDDLKELLKYTVYREDSLSHEFKYSNLGYLIGGIIIEQITGKSWKKYISENIFKPLGMVNSTTDINFDSFEAALPYEHDLSGPISSVKTENTLHSAGGIFSTLDDMAKWLNVFSDENQNSLNPELLKIYQKERTKVNKGMGPFSFDEYGNGWIFGSLMGKKLNLHFGSFYGYESIMSFQPETNSGIFVFVNEKTGGQRIAAMFCAYFYLNLSGDEKADDKIKMFTKYIDPLYEKEKPLLEVFSYDKPNELTGEYYSPEYGHLLVDKNSEGYTFQLGKLKSIAYSGEKENEMIIEWTPGIKEHFFILRKDGKVVLKYGEFSEFVKQ